MIVAGMPAEAVGAASAEPDRTAGDGASAIGLAPTRRYIPELESLRGIAILMVFVFHVDNFIRPGGKGGVSAVSGIIRAGHAGVVLFFVLSAFLLSLPFLGEAAGGPRVDVRNYFARRALRILPAYYVAVVLGTVLAAHAPRDLLHGLPFLFFLNAFAGIWQPIFPYSTGWWSLATEVQFYLLLPLLPVLWRTWRRRVATLVGLVGYAFVYRAILHGGLLMKSLEAQLLLQASVVFRAPAFLIGIVAAAVYRRHGRTLGSSRVDLQACKLEYSIVSPK